MPEATGTIHLLGRVYGEMRPDEVVPLTPEAQQRQDALTHGDEDVLPVVIGVGVGKSTRGWKYTAPYLQKFVDTTNRTGMIGILGHQRDEDLGHQFPEPATHWLAAKFDPEAPVLDRDGKPTGDKGVAFFRGVVDKKMADLKRWIRGKMVTQPSIYGRPMLRRAASGEQEVFDGEPLSIDWAPLGRAGMSTASVLAWGEMDAIGAPVAAPQNPPDGTGGKTVTTVREAIDALRDQGVTPSQVMQQMNWRARDVVPVLAAEDRRGLAESIGRDVLGQVAAGEIAQAQKPSDLLPAFNLKLADVGPIVDKTEWERMDAEHKSYGEMRGLLGLPETATPAEVSAKVKANAETLANIGRDSLKSKVETLTGAKGEMAVADPIRPLVVKEALANLQIGADDAAVKEAITKAKADPAIKPLIDSTLGTVVVRSVQQQTNAAGEMHTGAATGETQTNSQNTVGLPVRRRTI